MQISKTMLNKFIYTVIVTIFSFTSIFTTSSAYSAPIVVLNDKIAISQNDVTIKDSSVITEQKQATETVGETQSNTENIVSDIEKTTEVIEIRKSDEEVANEVLKGLWGNGIERQLKLEADGRDYSKIQELVTKKAPKLKVTSDKKTKRVTNNKPSKNPLNPSMGVKYFNGHRETWYSQKVLPGKGLNIPGRHIAEDGTIRDINNYIVLASDLSYAARGTLILTSLGMGKVYDTGCPYGTIDIYTNW